jgi:hypothetical protein
MFVALSRALMEAHRHRGFAFGFFYRSGNSGPVLPVSEVSNAVIILLIRVRR